MFVIHVTDKELVARICKELLHANKTKTNNRIEIWPRDLSPNKLTHGANKH